MADKKKSLAKKAPAKKKPSTEIVVAKEEARTAIELINVDDVDLIYVAKGTRGIIMVMAKQPSRKIYGPGIELTPEQFGPFEIVRLSHDDMARLKTEELQVPDTFGGKEAPDKAGFRLSLIYQNGGFL